MRRTASSARVSRLSASCDYALNHAQHSIKDHSFNKYAKPCEKLKFSFNENFAYVKMNDPLRVQEKLIITRQEILLREM